MATSPSPKNQTMDKQTQADQNQKSSKALVWDCESSLYDSFELKSFERQLGLAIASRSLSMPHLSDNRTRHPLPPPGPPRPTSKKSFKFSRPFQKLIRSIFGSKATNNTLKQDGFYLLYGRSGSLSTIPEVPETGPDHAGFSPDIKSLVGRSASDRFAPASIGISCA